MPERRPSSGRLRCSTCKADKSFEEFAFQDITLGTRQSNCRRCHAAYRHTHYLAHKGDYIRRAVAQVSRRRDENRRQIYAYLLTHPCVDCRVADPLVLEFDHRDPSAKLKPVALMAVRMRWARVLIEIEKCDVRCVNCHRRRTAKQFHWSKADPSSKVMDTRE